MKKVLFFLLASLPFFAGAQGTSAQKADFKFSEQKREPVAKDEFTKNYNTGIAYYNRAVIQVQKSNATSREQIAKETLELFISAKPYLEKAHAANPSHTNTLTALAGTYYATNDAVNYKKMQEALAAAK